MTTTHTLKTTSGYTDCACGGCFETVVSNDVARPDLCDDCLEAGCEGPDSLECCAEGCEDCGENLRCGFCPSCDNDRFDAGGNLN